MIASVALRARCCRDHAHFNGPDEHAACVVCDWPMPLVKASLFPGVAEHVCMRCRPLVRKALRAALRPAPWLRGTQVPRRGPKTSHTNHNTQREESTR